METFQIEQSAGSLDVDAGSGLARTPKRGPV